MSKLIILRGNSGSGKTTIAKALQKKFGHGTMVISQDVIRREILYLKGSQEKPKVNDLIYIIASYGKENCDIVILEGILSSKKYESLLNKLSLAFKDNIFAYYFDIPFEETLKRNSQRQCANEFGEKEMRSWWNEKDLLKEIPEQILTMDMSQEDIVNKIYKDIENNRGEN